MRIKTNELSGAQLDWAVARAEGDEPLKVGGVGLRYSLDWSVAGPIIEREGIALGQTGDGWETTCDGAVYISGQTPLIAAMRCFVASRLGDEIELPTEL